MLVPIPKLAPTLLAVAPIIPLAGMPPSLRVRSKIPPVKAASAAIRPGRKAGFFSKNVPASFSTSDQNSSLSANSAAAATTRLTAS